MKLAVTAFLLVGFFCGNCHAQVISAQGTPAFGVAHQDDWLTEEWSGDERPYRRIRDEIDLSFAQGRVADELRARYASRAEKSPMNSLEQFGWIYLIYKGAMANEREPRKEIYKLLPIFLNFPFPRKYEFARVQFLVFASCSPQPKLRFLGLKLIERNPKDYDVKYHLAYVMDTRNVRQRKQAIALTQDLRKLRPQSPQPYFCSASIHFGIWVSSRSAIEAKLVIEHCRKFLQMALPDDPLRPQAKNMIKLATSS